MNYRHLFHAGNFADVFKHVTLITLIQSLLKKEKPFCYIETHAGIGSYDLKSAPAQKTMEYMTGIGKLLSLEKTPEVLNPYLNIIKNMNPNHQLRIYPGSPRLVRSLLRPNDKMILMELHPEDYRLLKKEFQNDKQVFVHQRDGYEGLKAFLPPQPRRGLVFIDPPYEEKDEWNILTENLISAYQRWMTGIFVAWYPIKSTNEALQFQQKISSLFQIEILIAELSIFPDDSPLQLNGSGMIIINPPWQIEIKLQAILPVLWEVLATTNQGHWQLKWLNKK